MTTYELDEVLIFVADFAARMDRCDNGEGVECATLDAALRHYAGLCCTFSAEVRQWARGVFAGRVAFDPMVEQVWLIEGGRLYSRAMEMWAHAQKSEAPCYILDGQTGLHAGLWDLYRLLKGWVTPTLADGPSARQGLALDPSASEEVRQRVASLPPLAAGWQPDDHRQQEMYRKLRTS